MSRNAGHHCLNPAKENPRPLNLPPRAARSGPTDFIHMPMFNGVSNLSMVCPDPANTSRSEPIRYYSKLSVYSRKSVDTPHMFFPAYPGQVSLLILMVLVYLLTLGCSSPSEWDVQWEEITEAMDAGNIQVAKTRLTGLLPMVQQEGPRSPHYAQVIFQLGAIAQREGQDKQAESYYWEALPLWAQSVGPEHPHMAVTLAALAALFEKRGNTATALPLLKRAVAIEEKAWGRSDSRRLPSLLAYQHLLHSVSRGSEAQAIEADIAQIQGTSPSVIE